ncbi:putative DNA-directed RNA polymerases I and III subunit RPAC1-like [Homarus americanus]|uniref:Putative DNA-directed RNA polymerases I and III subunit RPAC1-like n=1 Tax=Homarus americanus TaxID=6706 RepID=A0A8J5K8H8_HOMAM|nr:putative DNA-directed RNA polymerases I and III subunit RPAC1-like [Homarus americanus]
MDPTWFTGKKVARVNDARNDACSRNVFQYDIYVESHSALKSFEILEESVNIMIGKCDLLLAEIDKYTDSDVGN